MPPRERTRATTNSPRCRLTGGTLSTRTRRSWSPKTRSIPKSFLPQGLKGRVSTEGVEKGEGEPGGVDAVAGGLLSVEEGGAAVAQNSVDDRGLVGELGV